MPGAVDILRDQAKEKPPHQMQPKPYASTYYMIRTNKGKGNINENPDSNPAGFVLFYFMWLWNIHMEHSSYPILVVLSLFILKHNVSAVVFPINQAFICFLRYLLLPKCSQSRKDGILNLADNFHEQFTEGKMIFYKNYRVLNKGN